METFYTRYQDIQPQLKFPDNFAVVGVFSYTDEVIDNEKNPSTAWDNFYRQYGTKELFKRLGEPTDYAFDPRDIEILGEDGILTKSRYVLVGKKTMMNMVDELAKNQQKDDLIFGVRVIDKEGIITFPDSGSTGIELPMNIKDGHLDNVVEYMEIVHRYLKEDANQGESIEEAVAREAREREERKALEEQERQIQEELAKTADVREHEQYLKDTEEAIDDYSSVDMQTINDRLYQDVTQYVDSLFPKHEINTSLDELVDLNELEDPNSVKPIVDIAINNIKSRDERMTNELNYTREQLKAELQSMFEDGIEGYVKTAILRTQFPSEDNPNVSNVYTNKLIALDRERGDKLGVIENQVADYRRLQQLEYDDARENAILEAIRRAEEEFDREHGHEVEENTQIRKEDLMRVLERQYQENRLDIYRQASENRKDALEITISKLANDYDLDIERKKERYDEKVAQLSQETNKKAEEDISQANSNILSYMREAIQNREYIDSLVNQGVTAGLAEMSGELKAAKEGKQASDEQLAVLNQTIQDMHLNVSSMQDLIKDNNEVVTQVKEHYQEVADQSKRPFIITGTGDSQMKFESNNGETYDMVSDKLETTGKAIDNKHSWVKYGITAATVLALVGGGVWGVNTVIDAQQAQTANLESRIDEMQNDSTNPTLLDTLEVGQTVPVSNENGDVLNAEIIEINGDEVIARGEDNIEYVLDTSQLQQNAE